MNDRRDALIEGKVRMFRIRECVGAALSIRTQASLFLPHSLQSQLPRSRILARWYPKLTALAASATVVMAA